MNKAVFMDRDGTLTGHAHYLSDPNELRIPKSSINALRLLKDSEFKVIVVTNQSGIGRGYFTKDILDEIHGRMFDIIEGEGLRVDALYYCPHIPDENCSCRKPKPGLIEQAMKEHDIDPHGSFMVGDQSTDILAGQRAGLSTILVKTGYAGGDGILSVPADFVASDLFEAVKLILGR